MSYCKRILTPDKPAFCFGPVSAFSKAPFSALPKKFRDVSARTVSGGGTTTNADDRATVIQQKQKNNSTEEVVLVAALFLIIDVWLEVVQVQVQVQGV